MCSMGNSVSVCDAVSRKQRVRWQMIFDGNEQIQADFRFSREKERIFENV